MSIETTLIVTLICSALYAPLWWLTSPRRRVLRILMKEPNGSTAQYISEQSKIAFGRVIEILVKLKDESLVESYDVRSVRLYKLSNLARWRSL